MNHPLWSTDDAAEVQALCDLVAVRLHIRLLPRKKEKNRTWFIWAENQADHDRALPYLMGVRDMLFPFHPEEHDMLQVVKKNSEGAVVASKDMRVVLRSDEGPLIKI